MKKKQSDATVIAMDIGGTKIMTSVFSAGGKMLAKEVVPTLAQEGVDAVIGRICTSIDNMLTNKGIESSGTAGICISCAGGIDTGAGVVVTPSPALPGWVDIPLADIVRKRFNIPTWLVNDASAAALGEHCSGAGRGVDNLVLITVGTGIGGGIITDGVLYLGAVGAAGELGHMTIDSEGPECPCGNKGCLEMLASGAAVARGAIKCISEGEKSVLTDMADGNPDNITAEMVGDAARKADKLAWEIIEQAAYSLGIGMVNVVNIFNPEMIIIGGGMAALGDMLIEPGRKLVAERAFPVSSRAVRIVTAQLGNEAGVYGAAAFARSRIQGE